MKTIHMIGNAHIDPVWLWRWQEGFQEVKSTFQSALDRLDEYDDFVFTSSSAQYYSWIEKSCPEIFEKIRRRVSEGRWVLCGGWWVQPDCNIPGGESFARQALISQNYFLEKFGVTAKVGYNVDSFGHSGMLPQILKKSGMDAYVFMRPMAEEKTLPGNTFIWESDDGSQVLAYRLSYSYCTFKNLEEHIDRCSGEFSGPANEIMCFYGVGNHGGGPTIENLETIKKLRKKYAEEGIELALSDPQTFFNSIQKCKDRLPVVHSDLLNHSVGCYSVESEIKRLNRKAENALLSAEKYCVLSNVIGTGRYFSGFDTAWKDVLFNQFHDTLAGTAIREAYFDARNMYGEAISIASQNQNNALQSISFGINIERGDGVYPVVVFNPHSWAVESEVEIENSFSAIAEDLNKLAVTDSNGEKVLSQQITTVAKVPGRKRIVFNAAMPPLGYTLYKIQGIREELSYATMKASDNTLENDFIRVEVDSVSGGLRSVFDIKAGVDVFSGSAAVPVVIEDHSDTWSHGIFKFDKNCGNFEPVSFKLIETGTVKSSIRVISRYGDSTITQIFSLNSGRKEIFVDVRVDWREKFKCLKLEFPVAVGSPVATYETPFGNIVRATDGNEEPMQNWLDVTGTGANGGNSLYGVSILNDCKYGADVNQNVIRLTVLRSPVYAYHNPFKLGDDPDEYEYIDQGIQDFKYVIVPHQGSWKDAETIQKGMELNQPLTAVVESFHNGNLPASDSMIHISEPNIIMSAFKKAEKSDDYILRLYETYGLKTLAKVGLPKLSRIFSIEMGPYEIKTILIPADPEKEIRETDLIEL